VDLGVRLHAGGKPIPYDWRPSIVHCQLLFVREYPMGEKALRHIEQSLTSANVRLLQQRLRVLASQHSSVPIHAQRVDLKPADFRPAVSIFTVLPLILILMTITGAVYPAIDLTAGERERGTLEILVAAPVPRLGLLLAKYVSVLTVALLTATVNLLTMTITIMAGGMGQVLLGKSGWSPLVVAEVFCLMVLFAGFFSAVLLSLTSFARSFKEAQAYLIPLMLLALAPGLLSVMPGLELKGMLAVAPVINIVLLGRDLLEQNANPAMAAVVVITTFRTPPRPWRLPPACSARKTCFTARKAPGRTCSAGRVSRAQRQACRAPCCAWR
jgi:ABC-2 type transport system permease protein/sodium transport system permease protein